ncbi:MAG: MGH1-like glycoside hydrolase domain-containing protein [Propionicimonas sp.]
MDLPADAPWRLWGPYQSGRQWGTVREDYSANGDAWNYLPFDQSHARAYRWGEDGIGGLCDAHGFLHLSLALWNERDDRLKERWFGLTNSQGNHGEDVKEYWWALDATPTHSWGQLLYRYPQAAFPYEQLVAENGRRGRDEREFELSDTGILAGSRFFDVTITHAKESPDDVLLSVTAVNRGPDPAPLHLIPQLWFRNTWAWGRDDRRPTLELVRADDAGVSIAAHHAFLGDYRLEASGSPRVLFCDNETDAVGLFGPGARNASAYPTNGVNDAVVRGDLSKVNPAARGTKVGLDYRFAAVGPGESVTVTLRLRSSAHSEPAFGDAYAQVLNTRRSEADAFYAGVVPIGASGEDALIARRAFAGLLWGKQVYRYSVAEWLEGDPGQPPPPPERGAPGPAGRNTEWAHLELADVISMPDDWEYPWFAAWDLAFHAVTLAHVDPALAKDQLLLLCREWAQHPSGQLPAYEWSFSDVNPPVHAWATWLVYLIDGGRDRAFLARMVSKLLLNMGWWTNIKDEHGSNLFGGGFLGMDNISVFDRSRDVPSGHHLEQSDATSWVAFAFLGMLRIAQELARHDPGWSELPTTFLERFLSIAEASEAFGSAGVSLWDDVDGFYYDLLVDSAGRSEPVRVRSYVGLVPLLAVALTPEWVDDLDWYVRRRSWLEQHRKDLLDRRMIVHPDRGHGGALGLVPPERYARVLERMLDTAEFLSPHGIRSVSAAYRDSTTVQVGEQELSIQYAPGESDTGLFGGNSNWRGPIWLPINVLLVDAMRTYSEGAGTDLEVEVPTGSGRPVSLHDAAEDLSERLIGLFRPAPDGRRPSQPHDHPDDPLWNDHPTFSEYFHGDTGEGLGASHQTGWSSLVAHLICTRRP